MERRRRYCEMLIPREASFCPRHRKQLLTLKSTKLLLGFIFLVFVWCTASTCDMAGTDSEANEKVPIGKEGILSGTSGTLTPVATIEAALDQFLKSHSANDEYGMVQMMATGLVFTVDNGMKVLFIDHGEGIFKRKIGILEGEMKGCAGYVPYEWVKPL